MTAKRKVGRPRKEIDMAMLIKMVGIQCTAEECAGVFGICEDTLDARLKESGFENFSDFYKKHGQSGKVSLRRMQWKAAEDGNTGMLVWLGRQYLGQTEKVVNEHTGEGGKPIKLEWVVVEPAVKD